MTVLELVARDMLVRVRRRLDWLEHLDGDSATEGGRRLLYDGRDTPQAEADWRASAPAVASANAELETLANVLDGEVGVPLRRLADLFQLSDGEVELLRLCLAPLVEPGLASLYGHLQGHPSRSWATAQLAVRLFDHPSGGAWSPGLPLAVWGLVRSVESAPGEPAALVCDPQVCDYLAGCLGLDGSLLGVVREVERVEPLASWPVAEVTSLAERALSQEMSVRIRITGPPSSGRRSFGAAVAQNFSLPTLAVDSSRIDEADWDSTYVCVQRLAVMAGAALVWHGSHLDRPWPNHVAPVPLQFVAADPETSLAPCPALVEHRMDLPLPGLDERRQLWLRLWPEAAAWPAAELEALATRHVLPVGDLVAACRRGPSSAPEASEICRELARHRLGSLGQMLECPFGWDDLVVPPRLGQVLAEFAFEGCERAAFWEEPGRRRLFPRGTALVGLLAGPPGTGKTMAAQVIAAELDLDLYRIDLATVVSKYIGETAKNMRRIFARATDMDAVLFFDEADALFSKRTDVKDSHDRYANADTNYLLQLIEDFRGVALLATNKRSNIDPAFLRRMRYVFDFRRPDAAERSKIWHKVLGEMTEPEAAARLNGELGVLARDVEVSGAQIKNAVLGGLFTARQSREVLGLAHLRRGLERELAKEGRSVGRRVQVRGMN